MIYYRTVNLEPSQHTGINKLEDFHHSQSHFVLYTIRFDCSFYDDSGIPQYLRTLNK